MKEHGRLKDQADAHAIRQALASSNETWDAAESRLTSTLGRANALPPKKTVPPFAAQS